MAAFGWRSGAAIGGVNGDGLPDLVVAGYADVNNPVPDAQGGFPATVLGVRDLLFLNQGDATFREAGAEAGLEVAKFAHGLGVVLTDVDLDDDPDIYLANEPSPIASTRTSPGLMGPRPILRTSASAWRKSRPRRTWPTRGQAWASPAATTTGMRVPISS